MAMCYTEIKSREVKERWYDMTDNMRDIILRFSQQVKMIMGSKLDKVILYGSYARGDYNEHSDVDIIILTTLTDEEITETLIFDLAFDYQMEYGVDISVVVKNKNQFEYWLGALPFYNNIQKEGIVLRQY